MNPSTGTFISMDSYAGTIYDPVSLHKYLYANADPINNTDPSGNMTMTEAIGSLAIAAILTVAMISVMSQFKENTLKSGPITGFPANLRRDLEKMIEVFPAYKEELRNLIEIIPRIIFEIKLFEIVFKTYVDIVLIEIFPATSEKEPIFITIEGESGELSVRPEAGVTGSKKHGVNWNEGPARAKNTGKPQGQWAESDLDYASEMATRF